MGIAFDISRKTTKSVGGNLKEVKTQAKELLGTWKLVSCEHRLKDGGVHFPLGKDPVGQLIYSPEGFMSVSLMRSGRTLFKTPGLFEGSASEKTAAAESYVSYAGRYEIRSDKVIHSVELSLFPNWVGSTQERFFKFEQGKLLLHTQPFAMDGKEQVAYLIWEKAV